jgi:hypothetical protein
MIKLKRIYEPATPDDGVRVLVERLSGVLGPDSGRERSNRRAAVAARATCGGLREPCESQ